MNSYVLNEFTDMNSCVNDLKIFIYEFMKHHDDHDEIIHAFNVCIHCRLQVNGFCEMPVDIDLANDQLKPWDSDHKLLESVHTPIHDANSSHEVQAVDTFTYSFFRLAPSWHKGRLALIHFVHKTDPQLLVKVSTKGSSFQLADI